MPRPGSHRRQETPVCDMCGNDLDPLASAVCRFCGTFQSVSPARASAAERVRTINLEHGRPTADAALHRLELELDRARAAGVKAVRVIHGYGSSGKGGVLRVEVRAQIERLVRVGRLRDWAPGDDYTSRSEARRRLQERCPELREQERQDLGNPGIALVLI